MKPSKSFYVYAVSIILVAVVCVVTGLLVASKEQYEVLVQPALAPPPWLFSVVWPFLYLLMGVGIGYVFINGKEEKKISVILFCVQLALNFAWSFIFFTLEMRLAGLLIIAILSAFVIWMTFSFAKTSKIVAYMQIPYLLWLCFATYLNASMWFLNK